MSRHITPGVQRMLDRLGDVPLAVHSAAWDLLWWNPLWAALTGDPSALQGLERNVAWRHFTKPPGVIDFDAQHAEEFARDLAADLREAAGRYPRDPGLATLIGRLRAESPDFRRRWSEAHIARHRSSRKTATATPVGPIAIDCDVLTAPAPTSASSCTRWCPGLRTRPGSSCSRWRAPRYSSSDVDGGQSRS